MQNLIALFMPTDCQELQLLLICGLKVLPRGDEGLYFHFTDGETKQRCKNKPVEHQSASMASPWPPQEKPPKCSDFWVTYVNPGVRFCGLNLQVQLQMMPQKFSLTKVHGATVTPSGWMCQSVAPFFPSFQEVESEGTRCDWQLWLARPTLRTSRDLPFSFQPPTTFCFLLKVVDEIWNSSSHLPTPFTFLACGGGCSSPSWSLGGWAVSDQAYCFQLGALRFL